MISIELLQSDQWATVEALNSFVGVFAFSCGIRGGIPALIFGLLQALQIWADDELKSSTQVHQGAIFALSKEDKWVFTGGWDRTVKIQVCGHLNVMHFFQSLLFCRLPSLLTDTMRSFPSIGNF